MSVPLLSQLLAGNEQLRRAAWLRPLLGPFSRAIAMDAPAAAGTPPAAIVDPVELTPEQALAGTEAAPALASVPARRAPVRITKDTMQRERQAAAEAEPKPARRR